MECQKSHLTFKLQVSSVSQIRLQAMHIVNCVPWLNIMTILPAEGSMPSGIYEIRTPCEFQFDIVGIS